MVRLVLVFALLGFGSLRTAVAHPVVEGEELRRLDPRSVAPTRPTPPPEPPPRVRERTEVSWWTGPRWRTEVKVLGLVNRASAEEMDTTWSPGVRIQVGLRRHDTPSRSRGSGKSYPAALADGIIEAGKLWLVGNEVGIEVAASVLGRYGSSTAWATGISLDRSMLVPDEPARVAGRLSSVLGSFIPELGIGGWQGDVGVHAAIDWRASLLVRSGFGLDFALGGGTLLTDEKLTYVSIGFGGFVR